MVRAIRCITFSLIFLGSLSGFAQPTVSFTLPDTICQLEQFSPTDGSAGVNSYDWDFCSGDFEETPTASIITDESPLNRPYQFTVVEDGGNYYGFLPDRSGRSVIRFDFGNDLANPPSLTTLTFSITLSQPTHLDFIQEGGIWYALLVDHGFNRVYRVAFTDGIDDNSPDIADLGLGYNRPNQLVIVQDTSGIVAEMVSVNASRVDRLDFGNSILNPPSPSNYSIAGSSSLGNLTIEWFNGSYYGMATSSGNNKVFLLDWGANISGNPTRTELVTTGDAFTSPFGIEWVYDQGEYYAMATSSTNGNVYRLRFGDSLGGGATVENLGTLGTSVEKHGLSFTKVGSTWHGFVVSDLGALERLTFSNPCTAIPVTSTSGSPTVSYEGSGWQQITLTGYDTDSNRASYTDSIFVRNNGGAALALSADSLACQLNAIDFTATVLSGTFTSIDWDFGDGNFGNGTTVSHQYATGGQYLVTASGTLNTGCTADFNDTVWVYNAPDVSFTLPADNLCTNTALSFLNTSTGGADSVTVWSWDFNGQGSSTDEQGLFTFSDSGNKDITLVATIPGCADTLTQSLAVQEGPVANFSYTNNCFGDSVVFSNGSETNGVVYDWEFGDGDTSDLFAPKYQYTVANNYLIQLSVTDTVSGCVSITSDSIRVNDQDLAAVTVPSSPQQYETSSFLATDQTLVGDSITGYQWFFEGGQIGTEDNVDILFTLAGLQDVSVVVGTAQGCTDSVGVSVNVANSTAPFVSFTLLDTVCQLEQFSPSDASLGVNTYEWDFCSGDFEETPTSTLLTDALNRPYQLTVVEDGGNYYGFLPDRSGQSVSRFDFGTDLANTPTVTPLTFSLSLSQPTHIDFIEENGVWYGLLVDHGFNKIYRVTFTDGINDDSPDIEDLGFAYNRPNQLVIVQDTSGIVAEIISVNSSRMDRLDFGNSILNPPTASDYTIPGSSSLGNLTIEWYNGAYYGLATSSGNNNLYLLNWGTNITGTPTRAELPTTGDALTSPFGIQWMYDQGEYYAIATSSTNGEVYRLRFGDSLGGGAEVENLGDLGTSLEKHGVSLTKVGSTWHGFTVSDLGAIDRLTFSNPCVASPSISTDASPSVSFDGSGWQQITLTGYDVDSNRASHTDSVYVRSIDGAELALSADSIACQINAIDFSASVVSGSFTTINWDFGDTNTDNGTNVSHQYTASGQYIVTASGTLSSGCIADFTDTVWVYDQPNASFSLPTENLCTATELVFENTSTGGADTVTTWSWDYNGEGMSTDSQGAFTFSAPGTKTITLIASIPGCPDTLGLDVTLVAGPEAAFSYTNNCFGDSVLFTNGSETEGVSYLWYFGDGDSTTLFEPTHRYDTANNYPVELLVTDTLSGCVTSQVDTVRVNDGDLVAILDPTTLQQYQEGTFASQDLTFTGDSLISYHWVFQEDTVATTDSFDYFFTESGTLVFSLIATTAQGCTDSTGTTLDVAGSPVPVVDFSLPDTVCQLEAFSPTSSSLGVAQYAWDFCSGDLEQDLSTTALADQELLSRPYQFTVVEDNGSFYGFLPDRSGRSVPRFDFGDDLNNEPTTSPLTFSTDLSQPTDIQFIQEESVWYALLTDHGFNKVYRLTFTEGIHDDTPEIEDLGFNFNRPNQLVIVQDTSGIVAEMVSVNASRMDRLVFGSSILNDPSTTNYTVTGSSSLGNVTITKYKGEYYGLATSSGNNSLYWLEYGDAMEGTPIRTELTTTGAEMVSPFGVQFVFDHDQYYAMVTSSTNGEIYRLRFGDTLGGSPEVENLGDQGNDLGKHGISLTRVASTWFGFIVSDNGTLERFAFENPCLASPASSALLTPEVAYDTSGWQYITLTGTDEFGNFAARLDSVYVRGIGDVSVAVSSDSIYCVNSTVDFSVVPESGTFTGFTWDFGDGASATGTDVNHGYSTTGTYQVEIVGSLELGCDFTTQTSIAIYDTPVVNFSLAEGNLCTEDSLSFTNLTSGSPDSVLNWAWDYDGEATSSFSAGRHLFGSPGDKTIQLIASLPGCADTLSQVFSIEASPSASFTLETPCVQEFQTFNNISVGDNITTYRWDFGDGFTSSLASPNHDYEVAGEYRVSLQLENIFGCTDELVDTVTIHAQPVAAYIAEPICEGASTNFQDNSTVESANVTSWEWALMEAPDQVLATDQNPALTFEATANETVALQLKVYSTFGCTDSTTQNLPIVPIPQVQYSSTRNCLNEGFTLFNDSDLPENTEVSSLLWSIAGDQYTTDSVEFPMMEEEELEIELLVNLSNGCFATVTEPLLLSRPDDPAFAVDTLCVGETLVLTPSFPAAQTTYAWQVNSATPEEGTVVATSFPTSGLQEVTLFTTTANGCRDSLSQNVVVVDNPTAGFIPELTFAAAPITIGFSNLSTGASGYQWYFGDNAESQEENPLHEFSQPGEPTITLIVTSAQGCTDTAQASITLVAPQLDLILRDIFLTDGIGQSSDLILSVSNQGSVIVDTLDVAISIGESFTLVQRLATDIGPFSENNLTIPLGWQVPDSTTSESLCVTITPVVDAFFEEENQENNEQCIIINNLVEVTNVYPNPTSGPLTIPVIVSGEQTVTLRILNSQGSSLAEETLTLSNGLNTFQFDAQELEAGLYFVEILHPEYQRTIPWIRQ